MANRTIKEATSIKGTNPQYLIEKIIRNRIYDCRYWKEDCFGLTAELLVDKAMALDHIGGTFAHNVQATPFLCLVLKMLQIQPSKDIIVEFIRRSDYKYVRALGAYYMRLVGTSVDIFKYLEPLYIDYRKMKYKNSEGKLVLTHMDEYIDELLNKERVYNVILPRLQKRWVLEESELLAPRMSALDDDIAGEERSSSNSGEDTEGSGSEERPREAEERYKSRSPGDRHRKRCSSPYRESRGYSTHRHRHHQSHSDRRRGRSRSRSRSFSPHRKRRDKREHELRSERDRERRRERDQVTADKDMDSSGKKYSREELEEIRQQNELRASLGLKPLKL